MNSILPLSFVLLNTAAARLFRLRKSVLNSARLINDEVSQRRGGFRPWVGWFVTLTYRPGDHWAPRHITDYTKCLKAWAARKGVGVRYVWVAELQPVSGFVHYHVMVWLPRGVYMPKPDVPRLHRGRIYPAWWRFGFTNRVQARNAVAYMAKYATKSSSKTGKFPHGIRLHGAGGMSDAAKSEVRWWNFPKWVRSLWPLAEAAFLRVWPHGGGGVYHSETGECKQSAYERCMLVSPNGEKNVLFRRKGSMDNVPGWLRDCMTMGKVKTDIAMPCDGHTSLVMTYRYLDMQNELNQKARNAARAAVLAETIKPWLQQVRENWDEKLTPPGIDWRLPGWASHVPF